VLEKYGTVDSYLLSTDGVPDLTSYDAVVAMGGPMGAYDVTQNPWLLEEVESLRQALSGDVSIWGVCLGAQLLAAAAGGEVTRGPVPEVGVETVELTALAATDPVFGGLPDTFPVLQWHQDTFSLPEGAELLATGSAYRNQAFRIGSSYGLQFHVEASWDLAEDWLQLEAYRSSLETMVGGDGADQLRVRMRTEAPTMVTIAELIVTRWLDGLAETKSSS
jgi:GMP synthase-like glutamine amidotransferase